MYYPLYQTILNGAFDYNSLATIVEMSTSIPLIIVAYLAIILSYEITDACFAIGVLLIGLVDWGNQFEYETIGKLTFSYYDFFWFFGILFIFLKALNKQPIHTFSSLKNKSLRIQLKILILISSLFPVGLYFLISRGDLRLSISFFLVGSAISLLVASIVVEYFSSQLSKLTKEIELIFSSPTASNINNEALNNLSEEWEESLKIILNNKLYQDKIEATNEKLLLKKKAEISAQVSHDIRSPLSALNMALSSIDNLQEEKRILVRNAVNRINDIANTLSSSNAMDETPNSDSKINAFASNPQKIILLSPLIDSIISEKRIQYREKQSIEIESDINQGYGLFANINATELKRTISNLITNSCEAFPNEIGKVIVSVKSIGEKAVIIIHDNGKGIPEHILKRLGELGVSHGKEGTKSGSGLGVYHAKNTVEKSGGTFQIQSIEGKGTTIKLILDKESAPKWFVEKLLLSPNMVVTSLDDDISIHQVWKDRFESKNISKFGIEHKTFTSGNEFKEWIRSQTHTIDSMLSRLYLVDYELLNQNAMGLDLIDELGIGSQAILVTSLYEEDKIRERCEKLNVRLIPKTMTGFVPIEIEKPRELFHGILIDDDDITLMTWNMIAKEQNKKFVGFKTPGAFFIESKNFDFETPLFIDSNLGNGINGQDVAKRAFEAGFKTIYLATGYEASQFEPMTWVRGIVGKDPFPILEFKS